jgi:acyl-CoA thioesterase
MLSAQATAEAVRDALCARDRVVQALGMQVLSVSPGLATLRMAVRGDMVNGVGLCHGGLIFTLADSAFGFASNSHNELTVTSGMNIDFIAPAAPGDLLLAVAREVSRAGRHGLYDVSVTNQRGELVAMCRGRAHTKRGQAVLPGAGAGKQAPV